MLPGQLVAFIIGYAVLVSVALRGRGPLAAIAALIMVYGVYSLIYHGAYSIISSFIALSEWVNLRTFIYIFLSLFLAGTLREVGYLSLLVDGSSAVGCRFSFLAVPALIGLLPMPGGALVSAMAMRRKYLEEARMTPEWASFLNYWFRHIWVPVWPIFQSIIITAAVLEVAPMRVVAGTWPETPAAILGGLLVAAPALYRYGCKRSGRLLDLLKALWPFLLLAILVFTHIVGLLEALIVTLLAVLVILRPDWEKLRNALKLATNPRVHGVLAEALLLKELLTRTGAPYVMYGFAAKLGLPETMILFMVPFVLGLAAGGENFFAATAIPLLKTYIVASNGIINRLALLIAYTGGTMGVMVSPVHLCFALTVDYYHANTARTLALAALAAAATSIIVFLAALFLL
jgi:integral membrane protein (TIGR00529 family)